MSEAQIKHAEGRTAHDLTAFQQSILVVVADEPLYGLAVKRKLEDYYNEEINHGRLYPNLDALVEQGLIEKSQRDKRTNEYEITEEGRETILGQLHWIFNNLDTDSMLQLQSF